MSKTMEKITEIKNHTRCARYHRAHLGGDFTSPADPPVVSLTTIQVGTCLALSEDVMVPATGQGQCQQQRLVASCSGNRHLIGR